MIKQENRLGEQFYQKGRPSVVGRYLISGDFQLLALLRYGTRGGIYSTIVIKNSSITPLTDTVKYGDSCEAFNPKISLDLRDVSNRKEVCESYMSNFLNDFKADEEAFDRMFNSTNFGDSGPYIQFVGGGAPGSKR